MHTIAQTCKDLHLFMFLLSQCYPPLRASYRSPESKSLWAIEPVCAFRGPMTPYTPLNIANIHNIDLIPPTHQYLLTPVNIYEFLLPPINVCQPPLPCTHSYCPLNINYFRQPPPNIQYLTTPIPPG